MTSAMPETTPVTEMAIEPCPCCGSPAFEYGMLDDYGGFIVECENCHIRTSCNDDRGVARWIWNTRALATRTPEAAQVEELREELAEVTDVAKGCAKREHQYFADRKALLLALKRSRIALNRVPANDKRFDAANHAAIKVATDIIDAALAQVRHPLEKPRA